MVLTLTSKLHYRHVTVSVFLSHHVQGISTSAADGEDTTDSYYYLYYAQLRFRTRFKRHTLHITNAISHEIRTPLQS